VYRSGVGFPASIGVAELRTSPFLACDGAVARELVSGDTFTLSADEQAILARAATGIGIGTLSPAERAIASSLLSHRLLLDREALIEIGARTLGAMDLEVAGACNAECTFCPRDELKAGRGVGIMREETFRALLDTFAPYLQFVGFAGIGEPTLHKQLPSFVAAFHARGIRTMVVTNGSMLTDALVEHLLEAGLGAVQVSLNGLDKASYEDHMVGLVLDETLPRVERMIERARGKIPIYISAVETEQNREQLAGFVDHWRARGVEATIVPCHSRGGTIIPLKLRREPDPAPRCGLFSSRVFVSWDGRVLACCHDVDGQTELGHVTDGADAIIARKLSIMGGASWFPICATCDEPARLHRLAFSQRSL
jgi:sulfatase maturation enzyme AslB (radical SAM superfamily)